MFKNSPFIIASDLDGTLADHTRMKIHFAKELGYALSRPEATSDVMKTKVSAEDYKKITSLIYGTGSLNASVMPHAKETAAQLTAAFGPLYIISRRGTGIEATYGMKWIQAHLIPPFQKDSIFFVRDDAEKQAAAQRLGVSLYIDDKQDVLAQMPGVKHRILFDPYDNFPHSRFARIRSWEDLPRHIENLRNRY